MVRGGREHPTITTSCRTRLVETKRAKGILICRRRPVRDRNTGASAELVESLVPRSARRRRVSDKPMIDTMNDTARDLETELLEVERQIAHLRLVREKATYKLERAVRERDRLARHLLYLAKEEGAA